MLGSSSFSGEQRSPLTLWPYGHGPFGRILMDPQCLKHSRTQSYTTRKPGSIQHKSSYTTKSPSGPVVLKTGRSSDGLRAFLLSSVIITTFGFLTALCSEPGSWLASVGFFRVLPEIPRESTVGFTKLEHGCSMTYDHVCFVGLGLENGHAPSFWQIR